MNSVRKTNIVFEKGEEKSAEYVQDFSESTEDSIFIWAKRGSSGRVTFHSLGEAARVERRICIFADEDSSIEIAAIQNFSPQTIFLSQGVSRIRRNACVSWIDAHFSGKRVESRIEDFLVEEGAESSMRTLLLSSGQEAIFENTARHLAPHTRSRIRARGILGANVTISYRGIIDIGKKMSGAHGFQEGKFLLAAPDAKIDASPFLGVASPEVSSSHSLSISRLHDADFFYPGLRGIAPYRAQTLLFEGFLLSDLTENLSEGTSKKVCDMVREKLKSGVYT